MYIPVIHLSTDYIKYRKRRSYIDEYIRMALAESVNESKKKTGFTKK